jgi:hypothetical protein
VGLLGEVSGFRTALNPLFFVVFQNKGLQNSQKFL